MTSLGARLARSWKLVVDLSVERATVIPFPYASPLLEKERHTLLSTSIADLAHPLRSHRARTCSAFASDDHPADTGKIQVSSEALKKRLDREKPDSGRRLPQSFDAR